MTIQPEPVATGEQRSILAVCVLAAFADGAQADTERSRIEQIVNGFSAEGADLTATYQNVLSGKITLSGAARELQTPSSKALAYEMAVCVCNADGISNDVERKFLADLRQLLQLDSTNAEAHQQSAQNIVALPMNNPAPLTTDVNRDAELDRQILNAAILNGALEIIPHTLSTMAIVPLQMRMVYRIGKAYGYELDRGHIKDFLATVGVGLTSQVFERFTQQLIGGFTRRLTGRLIGGLIGQAAGSAVGFATTYALGQVAKRYYASGRTLTASQLKEVFSSMLQQGRSLQGRYSGDINTRARTTNVSEILPLVKQT